jgi:hypothetical protein
VLLPHYATDRFWYAAFAYVLSMVFYFLSLFADVRAIQHNFRHFWRWKSLAIGALIISVLLMEIQMFLFFLVLQPQILG